ncbi:MAG: ribosome assembly cofactor RimP [Duncaniella sp.]|nr:ribosome assembly cofactor RimP [Duncaniella sp.]
MIDKQQVAAVVDKAIEGTDAFVVEITVSAQNDIVVELDSPTGVDLDFCTEVSDKINEAFDRDKEDYSLEVGSSSLTAPFKVAGQWEKNLGNQIEVFTKDGKKIVGTLSAWTPEKFELTVTRKVKDPDKKRPVMTEVVEVFTPDQVREACYHIDFK